MKKNMNVFMAFAAILTIAMSLLLITPVFACAESTDNGFDAEVSPLVLLSPQEAIDMLEESGMEIVDWEVSKEDVWYLNITFNNLRVMFIEMFDENNIDVTLVEEFISKHRDLVVDAYAGMELWLSRHLSYLPCVDSECDEMYSCLFANGMTFHFSTITGMKEFILMNQDSLEYPWWDTSKTCTPDGFYTAVGYACDMLEDYLECEVSVFFLDSKPCLGTEEVYVPLHEGNTCFNYDENLEKQDTFMVSRRAMSEFAYLYETTASAY